MGKSNYNYLKIIFCKLLKKSLFDENLHSIHIFLYGLIFIIFLIVM